MQTNELKQTASKKIPRVLIGAASSGSGKTTITCGLLQALINRGLKVSSFKCGPDYIDPMFHSRVIGASSANLDLFFSDADTVRYLFANSASDSDISVIEGVMGYYDGLSITSSQASAYDVAVTLDIPTILVVDAKGASASVVATILGFLNYKEDHHIKGVILNRMSERVYNEIKELITEKLGIAVLGYVPPMPEMVIESRHLGLVTPDNIADLKSRLNFIADVFEKTLDIDQIIALAQTAPEFIYQPQLLTPVEGAPRIAVAKDEAFCFMYKDNLDLLKELGAELVYFSPLHDKAVPDADGLILYGGYPELYAEKLSANQTMITSIKELIAKGLPCLAECGGFMYLHEEMEDAQGHFYPMCGVVAGKTYKTTKLVRFGYVNLTAPKPNWLLKSQESVKAHEFHYWNSTNCGQDLLATKAAGNKSWECSHAAERLFAGYPHLFYRSCPELIKRFLEACRAFRADTGQIP